VGLGSQELRPGRTGPPRSLSETMGTEDPSDGGGSDRDPERAELALDPDVAPEDSLGPSAGRRLGAQRRRQADRVSFQIGTSTRVGPADGATGGGSRVSPGTPTSAPVAGAGSPLPGTADRSGGTSAGSPADGGRRAGEAGPRSPLRVLPGRALAGIPGHDAPGSTGSR
jgi:hypothetical protein